MKDKKNKLLKSHLIDFYKSNERPNQKIGVEVEKVGIRKTDWTPPTYTGKDGYLAILGRLKEELGWNIIKQEEKYILEMERQGTHLALESDGRIELAGRPHESLHDLVREFKLHQNEINEISDVYGIGWLGVGYHPLSMNKDIKHIPIARKQELHNYLTKIKEKTGNDFALAYAKKTSGIHVNIDYSSEEDFALKSKLAFKLSPVFTAIFANSPFSKNEFTGHMSYRQHVTTNTGVPRYTVSKNFYESDFKYHNWLDEILDHRILFLKKGEQWIYPEINFNTYLNEGIDDSDPNFDDFLFHLKTIWTPVRLQNVIELRCFDSLPPQLIPCVPALIKGLFYNNDNLKRLEEITSPWSYEEWQDLEQEVAKYGLQAKIQGEKLIYFAEEMLNMAEKSLKENKIIDYYGNDESIYLGAIQNFICIKGKSPAEWLTEEWHGKWNKNFFPAIEWWSY